MNESILTKATKIAKIIDDNTERDEALSKIAQLQAAVNHPNDALETISQIRFGDIRSDAIRKSLDNLLTRFNLKNESMPQLNLWLEKLMDETLAIPNSQNRCSRLNLIILLILPRLEKELAINLLKQFRNEIVLMDNAVNRCKYLFAVCEMFQQFQLKDEAVATLKLIQKRISDIDSPIDQGLLLGHLANEFWKNQDYASAFECLGRIENKKVQSYARLQLIELLTLCGKFNDAQQIIRRMENGDLKDAGEIISRMGSFIFQTYSADIDNILININRSFVFDDLLNKTHPEESVFSSERQSKQVPRWINYMLLIKSIDNYRDSIQLEYDKQSNIGQNDDNIVLENVLESYSQIIRLNSNKPDDEDDNEPWKESDDEDDNEPWKESDDEDDNEPWKESDDADDNEPWKESDDEDDNELWKESDDEDDNEPWKEFDINDDNAPWKELDIDNDNEPWKDSNDEDDNKSMYNSMEMERFKDFIRKGAHRFNEFRKQFEYFYDKFFIHIKNNKDFSLDTFYNITKTTQGIIMFNQPFPPRLLQKLLRKMCIVLHFPNHGKGNAEYFYQKAEKNEDFINRQEEIGFDDALQEVIIQGNYQFAVECALKRYYAENKDDIVFGSEYLY